MHSVISLNQPWDLSACTSPAFTFWSDALVMVLLVLCLTVIVLLGPDWLREARAIFTEREAC